MRIALLHFDLAGGPESENRATLKKGIRMAASLGANWIVTPETALQGYLFYDKNPSAPIPERKDIYFDFLPLAKNYGVTLFLSSAEHDERDGKDYNTCFVLNSYGQCVGWHRKMFSHQSGAEGWLDLGHEVELFPLRPVPASVLVCADSYYEESCRKVREKGAPLVIVPAAWPPGECCPDPPAVWERCSAWTDAPVVVCNQTGKFMAGQHEMDMEQAKSGLVYKGHMVFSYKGKPAILLLDWDEVKGEPASSAFQAVEFLD